MTGAAAGSSIDRIGSLSDSAVAELVGDDARWAQAELLDRQVMVADRIDQHEHARRREIGLDGICDSDDLELLMGLPVGHPVAIEALSARERRALRHVPLGALQRDRQQVQRLAVHPLTVKAVLVPARTWRSGLVAAGIFAPFATRVMVLSAEPRDAESMRMEAEYYGIGVLVVNEGESRLLVAPRQFVRRRHTAAGWRFAERLYQQVRLLDS